tara:strand:+ start:241 stop:756 length:516 start_codon:yes stop_codon:yes gene_type:complete
MPRINSINEFTEHMGSMFKPSQYIVTINSPWGTWEDAMAESVTLPGRSIATMERRTGHGPQRDMPYERLYGGDLDMTFIFARGGGESHREQLETWMHNIIGESNNVLQQYDDYIGSMTIEIEHPQGEGNFAIEVQEVYPKAISPVDLSWTMNDSYIRQSVSFGFREYFIKQ